jgi:hypothetical protein
MGESVGYDIALTAPLQSIIADSRRCLHGCLDIAGLDKPPLVLRVVCPHPGEAVGLQFDPHLQVIGLHLIHTALCRLYLGQDAKQVLHMMANFVGDHVGLRELAALASDVAATESSLEIFKECGIQIDFLVESAIERPQKLLSPGPVASWHSVWTAGVARGVGLPLRSRTPQAKARQQDYDHAQELIAKHPVVWWHGVAVELS